MLAEFSVIPIGEGESLGAQISEVLAIVDASGLPYRLNPMGTVIEGDWDQVMPLIRHCHDRLLRDGTRVVTSITIDDRPGKLGRIEEKIKSLERRLGRTFKS